MIYLNSKYISEKLGINLAKWKRWSRAFLDPDPLGGFQSGYARQFSRKEAFRVYVGGYLVAHFKFTIPEAGQILTDLNFWLTRNQYYSFPLNVSELLDDHHIYIYRLEERSFGYTVRTMTGDRLKRTGAGWQENFKIEFIRLKQQSILTNQFGHAQVLHIHTLRNQFLAMINTK